jgi:hypothetical protein
MYTKLIKMLKPIKLKPKLTVVGVGGDVIRDPATRLEAAVDDFVVNLWAWFTMGFRPELATQQVYLIFLA